MVFLSLCASDINEVPRGVAIFRAKSMAIVVASPKLALDFNVSMEDMKLVNLFARFAKRTMVWCAASGW